MNSKTGAATAHAGLGHSMGSKKKYVVSVGFMLLLFGVTYGLLFRSYDIRQCFEIIGDVAPGFMLLALACAFGYILGEGLNIKVCMQALGYPTTVIGGIKFAMVGFYFCAITPSASGGQPVQIYYMSKEGYPVAESAMSIMLISVMFKVVMLAVGLPIALIEGRLIFRGLPYFRTLFALGIAIMVTVTGLLLFVMFSKTLIYRAVQLVVRLLGRMRLVRHPEQRLEKWLKLVDGYHEAAALIRGKPRLSVKVFFITLVQRAVMFSVAWCIYKAFGLTGLSWIDIVAIQIGLAIAVDQLPFPGAIGVSEKVFLGLYRGIYGAQLLVPAMVLTRGCTYYLPMIVSGIVTGIFHFRLMGKQVPRPSEVVRRAKNKRKGG